MLAVAEVGVVLKVPQPTHTRFKEACAKHDRSMQKVLLSLIEGWVANGAPDPCSYGGKSEGRKQLSVEDLKARQAIVDLASALQKMQVRLELLERSGQPALDEGPDFDAFYDALRQAATDDAAQPLNL
jgi:hypothetical protein